MAESGSGFTPLAKTIRAVSLGALVLLAVQVWINDAADRAKVLCYPPYLTVRLFGVTLVQIAFPREHVFLIKSSAFTNRFYTKCVDITAGLPGFH